MKRTFEMNGNQYNSIMEMARELGVKRIYAKDFAKYGIVETTGNTEGDAAQVTENPVVETVEDSNDEQLEMTTDQETTESDGATEDTSDDISEDTSDDTSEDGDATKKEMDNSEQPKVDRRFTRKVGTPDEIREVQSKVNSMTIVEFSNFIKHFSLDALTKLSKDAGLDIWDTMSSEPIRRMRLIMGLKEYYYPNEKTPVKSGSGWRKIELAKLVDLANSRKVEYKNSDDNRILRMHLVVALNKAGLTPDDISKEETTQKNA